jgi:hypothetical protein
MSVSLVEIGLELVRVILPVIIIIGVVGNSLNIAVLTRRALYHHACSRYFLAVAGNDLFYLALVLTNQLLISGYQINLENYSTFLCRMISYIGALSSFISPYLIVFATINRYCASSTNVQIRKFNSVRVSKWIIFIVIAVISLVLINILVLFDLQPTKGYYCTLPADSIYGQVYIIIQVFMYAVIPPSFMMFFGLMTIRNTNRPRIVPVVVSRYTRTEQQLARMLFLQVGVHILLTLPLCVTYLIAVLPNTISTTSTFSFASSITLILIACSYGSSFFLYLLSGRVYRKELIQLVHTIFRIRRGNQIEPQVNGSISLRVTATVRPRLTP